MVDAVIDYMTQPADAGTLKAFSVGVMPYVAPRAWGWPKAVTAGQLRDLERTGVPYSLNFETNTGQMEGGIQAGIRDGQSVDTARTELLVNDGRPQYFSCDEPVDPSRFGIMADYVRGARTVLGAAIPLGVYGEGALIEYLVGQGLITYGWESESTSFPGNSAPTPHTVLRQCYGKTVPGLCGSYDTNDVLAADWGQWPSATPADPPPPPPERIAMQWFDDGTNSGHGVFVDSKGSIQYHGGNVKLVKDDGTPYTTTTDPAFYGGVICIKENPDNATNGMFYDGAFPLAADGKVGFGKAYLNGKGGYWPTVNYWFAK